ncbi:hypothetical protein PN441_01730 [Spirulina major CS-329]|nr:MULTISPECIES: hypothetical protein [Spirulina]MDB9493527.1 hypothetical protein [Spirulina subsalsa CS-330]MDB9501774.1 hypothetical protein [Spirulina major CS-329]
MLLSVDIERSPPSQKATEVLTSVAFRNGSYRTSQIREDRQGA